MKTKFGWIIPGALLVATLGMAGCEVEKKEEGKLPDVDVKAGKLPKYDVDGPDVDVGTKEKTITVPDVDVDLPGDDDADLDEPRAPAPRQN